MSSAQDHKHAEEFFSPLAQHMEEATNPSEEETHTAQPQAPDPTSCSEQSVEPSSALESSGSPPSACWRRSLAEANYEVTQFQVGLGQIVKLAPLGMRMSRYVSKAKREGKEPFIDPFYGGTIRTDRGVPLGGVGCGSLTRSWTGEFNCFYLRPGRPTMGTVKANQFSLFVKRDGLPSQAFVLGQPFAEDGNMNNNTQQPTKQEGSTADIIEIPPAEPLPDSIATQLAQGSADPSAPSTPNTGDGAEESLPSAAATPAAVGETKRTAPTTAKTTYINPTAALDGWNWKKMAGEYHGLFPRAWTTYDMKKVDKRLEISCEQISPVIPHNYKETSYPCSVFVYTVQNTHPTKAVEISLMFTFHNGTGEMTDYMGGHHNQRFRDCDDDLVGVELVHNKPTYCVEGDVQKCFRDPLSFGIATGAAQMQQEDGSWISSEQCTSQLSAATTFQTTGHGDNLWRSFSLTGKAIMPDKSASSSPKEVGIGSAVANKVLIPPNSTVQIPFVLGWDRPIVRFGEGRGVHPRYTRFYGTSGHAVQQICRDALNQWRQWEAAIDAWQRPILENPSLPSWYKCALFNELYYIVAGGSLWIDREESIESHHAREVKPVAEKAGVVISSLQQDKEHAHKVLEDFIQLTENSSDGIMLRNQQDLKTGRIVFSPEEIEEGSTYLTNNGNTLRRTSLETVELAGRITLFARKPESGEKASFSPEHPSEFSEEPDTTSVAVEEKADSTSENSLFDYGEYGLYLYLEGQEYLMYNTYDVHFYASFALVSLWPQLELNLQKNVARSTLIHQPSDKHLTLHTGELRPRKLRGAVPHDVGTPSGDPLYTVNSYCIHDVNCWKDLNSKFALQIYRDYVATDDKEFLAECYPVVWECMHYLERFDEDRDGMIENTGFPDQTYDTWTATGPSAYCGGLWVAALDAMVKMSEILGKEDDHVYYKKLHEKAFGVYQTLYHEEHFRYDTSGRYDDIIMADQLAGQWYARASGLDPVASEEMISTSLRSVFKYNVESFHNGELGAVNGFNKRLGTADYTSMQSYEVWTGTNFGLAANCLQEGLSTEGWRIAQSIYECVYEKFGYWYQTPEAWDESGHYRSYAYMRPLAIWSIQWAIDRGIFTPSSSSFSESTKQEKNAPAPVSEESEPAPLEERAPEHEKESTSEVENPQEQENEALPEESDQSTVEEVGVSEEYQAEEEPDCTASEVETEPVLEDSVTAEVVESPVEVSPSEMEEIQQEEVESIKEETEPQPLPDQSESDITNEQLQELTNEQEPSTPEEPEELEESPPEQTPLDDTQEQIPGDEQ